MNAEAQRAYHDDVWSDEELAELCVCGHVLHQHEFGCEASPCDHRVQDGCNCYRFQPSNAYTDAAMAARAAPRER